MHPISWNLLLSVTLSTVCFAAFTWGVKRHFLVHQRVPSGTVVMGALGLLGMGVFLVSVVMQPHGAAMPVALYAASLTLFLWAVVATRRQRLTLAFSEDSPQHLAADGPYRFVRHPFYVSYMLFWLANAVATAAWAPWIVLAAMSGIYVLAAVREEGKFMRSTVGDLYEEYRRQTGMFFPKIGPGLLKGAPGVAPRA